MAKKKSEEYVVVKLSEAGFFEASKAEDAVLLYRDTFGLDEDEAVYAVPSSALGKCKFEISHSVAVTKVPE